ncbi:cytochrome P450 [Boletus edulis]|nr:cytochrome P450 [Boletus edulis]KAF8125513.1 cytochrome P450 [Boletus edulis]
MSMNRISLDTIGLTGFSHNFGALVQGKQSSVAGFFDAFATTTFDIGHILLGQVFPLLILLARTQKKMEERVVGGKEERSVIGLLIKGGSDDSQFRLSTEEIITQMIILLLAGYETTAISLTWALLELSRNVDVQTKLRRELLEHVPDPTYDQLSNGLPYLDAVVHEILRIHPPAVEVTRVAIEDNLIPLSKPVRSKSGELIDSLTIAKGSLVAIPMECMCLGKNFVVTEFKLVLVVLVKNSVFELRDGVDSKIEIGRGLLPRPKLVCEVGCT